MPIYTNQINFFKFISFSADIILGGEGPFCDWVFQTSTGTETVLDNAKTIGHYKRLCWIT